MNMSFFITSMVIATLSVLPIFGGFTYWSYRLKRKEKRWQQILLFSEVKKLLDRMPEELSPYERDRIAHALFLANREMFKGMKIIDSMAHSIWILAIKLVNNRLDEVTEKDMRSARVHIHYHELWLAHRK
ncbi:hypothetical protein [Paenibacillus taichungensis]|uniref:hypothetical protein n=1 Tax=Paenibacillus taichungensis TaxID=484184 RepID=UPI0035D7E0D2